MLEQAPGHPCSVYSTKHKHTPLQDFTTIKKKIRSQPPLARQATDYPSVGIPVRARRQKNIYSKNSTTALQRYATLLKKLVFWARLDLLFLCETWCVYTNLDFQYRIKKGFLMFRAKVDPKCLDSQFLKYCRVLYPQLLSYIFLHTTWASNSCLGPQKRTTESHEAKIFLCDRRRHTAAFYVAASPKTTLVIAWWMSYIESFATLKYRIFDISYPLASPWPFADAERDISTYHIDYSIEIVSIWFICYRYHIISIWYFTVSVSYHIALWLSFDSPRQQQQKHVR